MKTINLLLAAFLFSNVAFAGQPPKVGDESQISYIKYVEGKVENNTICKRRILEEGLDNGPHEHQFLVNATCQDNSFNETSWIHISSLPYLDDTTQECDARFYAPGTKVSLETIQVPAGTFLACKISYKADNYEDAYWYSSDVPFGMLKAEINWINPQGLSIKWESNLVSFIR